MSETEQVRRILTVVYVAMIAAVGVCFLLVAFLAVPGSESSPAPHARRALLVLGVGQYLLATMLARRRASAGTRAALERVRTGYLIRFAAAEALAIFGIALHFLGAPAGSVLVFLGTSASAFALAFPSRKAFGRAVERAGGAQS